MSTTLTVHVLGRNGESVPAINKAGFGVHEVGRAADLDFINVNLSSDQLDDYLTQSGLYMPCRDTDSAIHVQLINDPYDPPANRCKLSAQITFNGRSPINILVTDPDGNKVGYDFENRKEIIDVDGAFYSGGFTEPQVVTFPMVKPGSYLIAGIGTGNGPYKITMSGKIEGVEWEEVVSEGVANINELIQIISPIDIFGESGGVEFKRGDSNDDGATDISDAIAILFYAFMGEPIPCKKAADVDNNGKIEGVTDTVFLLRYLFLDEQAPDEPLRSCGIDQISDELTCDSFPACP